MSGLNEEGRNKLIEFADILKASKKFFSTVCKDYPIPSSCRNYLGTSFCCTQSTGDSVKETYDVGHLAPATD